MLEIPASLSANSHIGHGLAIRSLPCELTLATMIVSASCLHLTNAAISACRYIFSPVLHVQQSMLV